VSGPAIELTHLTRSFGAKVAVRDVSFSVREGDCYGLIGPNGAGKTTTFSMLCGFLAPTSGRLRVLGVDPFEPGALKGKVGVLPQDALLPASWPVGALLTHYASLSGLPSPEQEARSALERVQLPETWKVRAGTLSHGMAKRVAMAQALMGAPPVILLDEPTAGLDPRISAAIRGLIRELKRRHTVVVSSHNLQELEELCDATAILDQGRLVRAATMEEITGADAEFRVQIARGAVPLDEVRALSGCREARLEGPDVLAVRFDGQGVPAEDLITRTVALLAARGVLLSAVWKGKRLEEKVLQLT
jgi:ABC-type multidrug transport system ATPase subunit